MAKTLACMGVYYKEDEDKETAEFCVVCMHCSRQFGIPYRRCSESLFYCLCFKALGDVSHPKCAVMVPYPLKIFIEENIESFL